MGAEGGQTKIEFAKVDWVADAPWSISFSDVYFSGAGPEEKRHVFLAGNDLGARFTNGRSFALCELGFGAGLNFLETLALWRTAAKPGGVRLRYHSIEAYPLSPDDMARAHRAWPEHAEHSRLLRNLSPPAARGPHVLRFDEDVDLTLHYGDAFDVLSKLEGGFDAWFFDGFAPSKNPQLWSVEIFMEAARLSRRGATFATYAVAGNVRRALTCAGFEFEKRDGFGRKKEMLAGRLGSRSNPTPRRAPWHPRGEAAVAPGGTVAIVGGGIAGASLAFEARRAGLKPTIIDAERLAAGASGNVAGLIMPRIDLGGGPAARLFLSAYLHTVRLLTEIAPSAIIPCGALLAATNDGERARHQKILAAKLLPDGWIKGHADGLFFPQAVVVDPVAYVKAVAGDAEIVIAEARTAKPDAAGVLLRFADGGARRFDAAILANGADALKFRCASGLPLKKVPGQIDWFKNAPAPDTIVAFGPYAAPAPRGGLIIGATYGELEEAAATRSNIDAIAAHSPDIVTGISPNSSAPRRAARCQTPDRFPVAGPLPDLAFYGAEYDDLRLGVKRDYPPGKCVPGLFALTGLGSRGLVTAPLAAAHVVAEMTGAPSPLDELVAEALHPARFFIRDLRRAARRRPL